MLAQLQRFKPIANRTAAQPPQQRPRGADGLIRVRSAYRFEESIDRLRQAIAARGIPFFGAVDQARLAAGAGIRLRPSTLLVFGTPSLGAQFLKALRGIVERPVRILA